MQTPYTQNGYTNRNEYLDSLSIDYDGEAVHMLADLLGPSEDFDGLVRVLEDWFDE